MSDQPAADDYGVRAEALRWILAVLTRDPSLATTITSIERMGDVTTYLAGTAGRQSFSNPLRL